MGGTPPPPPHHEVTLAEGVRPWPCFLDPAAGRDPVRLPRNPVRPHGPDSGRLRTGNRRGVTLSTFDSPDVQTEQNSRVTLSTCPPPGPTCWPVTLSVCRAAQGTTTALPKAQTDRPVTLSPWRADRRLRSLKGQYINTPSQISRQLLASRPCAPPDP